MTLEQLIAKLDVKLRLAPHGKCIEVPQCMAKLVLEALKNIPEYRRRSAYLNDRALRHESELAEEKSCTDNAEANLVKEKARADEAELRLRNVAAGPYPNHGKDLS